MTQEVSEQQVIPEVQQAIDEWFTTIYYPDQKIESNLPF